MKRLFTVSSLLALSVGAYAGCGGKVTVDEGVGGSGGGSDTSTDTFTGTGTGTGSSTVTGTSTQTSTGTGTGTGTSTSTGTGTGTGTGGPEECWQQPGNACFDCCENNYQAEIEALNDLFVELCICGSGAPCAMVCNNVCNGMGNPSPPCDQCINDVQNNQDACIDETLNICFADPGCGPALECWGGC